MNDLTIIIPQFSCPNIFNISKIVKLYTYSPSYFRKDTIWIGNNELDKFLYDGLIQLA